MQPRLAGQVAVVTGGGSGFGEAIAGSFAREGARIVVADFNAAAGERVAAALRAAGHEAVSCPGDVAVSADMARIVAAAVETFGRLDVMVNNAGISHPNQPMLQVTEAQFDRLYQVNVKSLYLSAVHCVPVFRRQGGGSFINIASTAAMSRPSGSGLNVRGACTGVARTSGTLRRPRTRSPIRGCDGSGAPGSTIGSAV